MGRPIGTCNLTVEQIKQIVLFTKKGISRPKMAKQIGCNRATIYNYQRKLGLIS